MSKLLRNSRHAVVVIVLFVAHPHNYLVIIGWAADIATVADHALHL